MTDCINMATTGDVCTMHMLFPQNNCHTVRTLWCRICNTVPTLQCRIPFIM